MNLEDGLIEVKDAIKIFKCSEHTFRTWLKRGKLPANLVVKIGNTVRIRRKILEEMIFGLT